jgi:hypothetical protein
MRRGALFLFLLFSTSCGGRRAAPAVVPGDGALAIDIIPNPIVARAVEGSTYDFPFEVLIREVGGRPVDIRRVSATVFAMGSIRLASESYDAGKINSLGYPTRLPANGELRYRFVPRRSVGDDRLFGAVSAELRVEGEDDRGTPIAASTGVTVRRAAGSEHPEGAHAPPESGAADSE